jgi:hypothetical protein
MFLFLDVKHRRYSSSSHKIQAHNHGEKPQSEAKAQIQEEGPCKRKFLQISFMKSTRMACVDLAWHFCLYSYRISTSILDGRLIIYVLFKGSWHRLQEASTSRHQGDPQVRHPSYGTFCLSSLSLTQSDYAQCEKSHLSLGAIPLLLHLLTIEI